MPLYVYECEKCELEVEKVQPIGTADSDCPRCGQAMKKKATGPALVMIGKQTPSYRKKYLGTAPGTSRGQNPDHHNEGHKGGPGSKDPSAIAAGQKWLETMF